MKSLLFVVVSFSAVLACNTQKLDDAPDANIACNAGAHVFCDADAGSGCTIGPAETNPNLKQLPQGTYANGCVANFVSDARDVGGDCTVATVCHCQPGPNTGDPIAWACF